MENGGVQPCFGYLAYFSFEHERGGRILFLKNSTIIDLVYEHGIIHRKHIGVIDSIE